MKRVAIHGFGRIGRSTTRAALKSGLFVPVSISDITEPSILAALFGYDSNYGAWHERVEFKDGKFHIGDRQVAFFNSAKALPNWKELEVDLVVDCTGRATKREFAQAHLDAGAKRVLVSAPSKSLEDCDAVLLPGINLDQFDPSKHRIVSMASCTTNAIAPVVKVLRDTVGIKTGLFTTVHAYTNTQSLTDQPMKDRRDSWAAAENIIPSSSGAAKSLKFIWPDLSITGKAYRVPVRTGSIVELNVVLNKNSSEDEIKNIFRKAANESSLKGVMSVLEEEYASARILGDSHSSIIDLPLVQMMEGTLLSIAAWYDNEMGYSTRLAETAAKLAV
jgi:glyceraldehyde 3-phosphate dehydrogenase